MSVSDPLLCPHPRLAWNVCIQEGLLRMSHFKNFKPIKIQRCVFLVCPSSYCTHNCAVFAVARGSLDHFRASFRFQSSLPPHDLVLAVPCCPLTRSENQLVPKADLHVGSMTVRQLWSQSRTLGNFRGVCVFNSLFNSE